MKLEELNDSCTGYKILISAIFWRGNPYKVLQQGLKKNYSLYISSAILNELEEKLRIKFGLPQDKIEEQYSFRAYL